MTYNAEVIHQTSAEVNTQIASYFDVVDQCVQMSDTNKRYTINPQSCYAPSPPVQANSFTHVIISPNSDNTADLYNGFIKANMRCTFYPNTPLDQSLKGLDGGKFSRVWFGFKDAMDAIEKYEILSNGVSVYTQNFAIEESFITACGANEETKRADIYSRTRHKDVWDHSYGNRCGCVVQWVSSDGTVLPSATKTIPLKIDLRRFLPLSNIKYLPAFAGKIELRLYFGTAGMVCCPVGPSKTLRAKVNEMADISIDAVTNEFVQIGHELTIWNQYAANNSKLDIIKYKPISVGSSGENKIFQMPIWQDGDNYFTTADSGEILKIKDLKQFEAGEENNIEYLVENLKHDDKCIYQDEDRYYKIVKKVNLEGPPSDNFIIDDSIAEIHKCYASGELQAATKSLKSAKNRFYVRGDYQIDDCYSIVPCFGIDNNIYQQLVSRYIDTALTFPTQTISVHPLANSLTGISCSSTQTITPRFVDSIFVLFPLSTTHRSVYKNPLFKSIQLRCGGYGSLPAVPFSTDGTDPAFIEYCQNAMNVNGLQTGFNKEVVKSLCNDESYEKVSGLYSDDRTSFFIGLPTETDNTFQQGQTSNTPITYELQVVNADDGYRNITNLPPPRLCLLVDTTFSIQVQQNGMPPIVSIGAFDVTSPI